jgi:hypothetical protein
MNEETATQEVALDEANMQEFKAARAEGKEVATRETVSEEKPEAEEKPKAKGGFQARIDRLIKQQAALEEAKTAAEKKAADLEAKFGSKGEEAKPVVDGEPKREDFQNDIEYYRALTRWEVKQEMKAEREAEEKSKVEAANNAARGKYNQRMIALQAENEEYKELMSQDLKIPAAIHGPVTLEMENGPEVAIFLAQNPELCGELMEMTPSRAIAEVWKISEKLEAAGTEEKDEEEEKPVAKAAEEKPARKVPTPLRTVSGGSTRSTLPLDKTDYAAYKKLRAQGRVQ